MGAMMCDLFTNSAGLLEKPARLTGALDRHTAEPASPFSFARDRVSRRSLGLPKPSGDSFWLFGLRFALGQKDAAGCWLPARHEGRHDTRRTPGQCVTTETLCVQAYISTGEPLRPELGRTS